MVSWEKEVPESRTYNFHNPCNLLPLRYINLTPPTIDNYVVLGVYYIMGLDRVIMLNTRQPLKRNLHYTTTENNKLDLSCHNIIS